MPGLSIWLWLLAGLGLVLLIVLYFLDRRHTKVEVLRMQKMRNSKVYLDLLEIVYRCRRRPIEEIRIDREGVVFTMLMPVGRKIGFYFEPRGHRILTPGRIKTLYLLLGKDLPILGDKSRYALRREIAELPNGEKTLIYTYTMKSKYKDALYRAPELLERVV